ncbi:MAG: hypothetical protein M3R49_05460 [Chloroflexota bacterium]|nr:hypothetical protein [Chloroflexota bacterium]
MRGAAFETTRRTVLALLPTIGGADAERFLDDLAVRLTAAPALSGVRALKTTDPGRRFEVSCRFAGTPGTAARALRGAWRDLAGPEEAHLVESSDHQVRLRFITWTPTAWQATGTIVASRAPADSLGDRTASGGQGR